MKFIVFNSLLAFVLSAVLTAPAQAAPPECGIADDEKALGQLHWQAVMNVHFVPDSSPAIHGVLCAGFQKGTAFTIDSFSFKTDASFVGIFPVSPLKQGPRALISTSRTVLSNADVAKFSSVGAWAIRSGEVLTMGLAAVQSDEKARQTRYGLKLRFPETIARSVFYSQPNRFHEISLSVLRSHGKTSAWTEVDDLKQVCKSLTIEIRVSGVRVERIVVASSKKEFKLLPKDFPVEEGAFFAPKTKVLQASIHQLNRRDAEFSKQNSPVIKNVSR